MKICNTTFEVVGNPEFKLQSLLEADLVSVSEEIEEVTDGADKQLKIEHQLGEIKGQWRTKEFLFAEWKDPWRAHFQGNTNGHQGSVRNGDGGSTNKKHFRLLLSFPSFSYLFEDKDKKWHLYHLQSKQGECFSSISTLISYISNILLFNHIISTFLFSNLKSFLSIHPILLNMH